MADENKVQIHLDTQVSGEDLIVSLTAKLKVLEAQARSISTSMQNIGRPSSTYGGKDPAKGEAAAEGMKARSRRSKAKADADSLRSAKALDSFDKASIALFKTKLASQTKAASDALKTERQSFADFRSKASARNRYESSQVKALKERMTAERRIATMRSSAENEVVRQLKQKLNLQSQTETARQREASKAQRDQTKSDAAGIRSVRNLITTRSRMAAQRLAEERSAAREAAKGAAANAKVAQAVEMDRVRAIRDAGRLQVQEDRRIARERASARRTFRSSASDSYQRGGEAYRALSRPGPVVAAVAGGAAAVATRKAVTTRSDTDAAETQLRIFGSEPASGNNPGSTMTQADVVKLRSEWLDRAALDNGMTPADAIRAYTEVLKAGIDPTKARDVTEQMLASRAGMDMELKSITSIVGKVMTNRPDLDLKKFQNSFAIAAGTTAADPNQLVQAAKRSMGLLAATNMSPQDLNAFNATMIGAGVEAGKAGNFNTETGITLQNAKNERGQRLKDLNEVGRLTGFGSARGLSDAMSRDAAGTMEAFYERTAKLDEKQRALVARRLGGREWDDEILSGINAVGTLKKTRQAVNDPRNADYLDRAKAERMNSWGGMWSKSLSVFLLFWEKFGAGFDQLLRDVNAFFSEVGRSFDFNKVTDVVRSALDGIKSGLGLNTWKEGFDQIKQWMASVDIKSAMEGFTGFAKGFAQGVTDVVASIKKVFSLFSAGDTSPETMGRWTSRIMGLSIALAVLGPVLGILGGLVSLVVSLARAATAIRALVGIGGAAAATGATAGAATGAGLLFKGLGLTLSRMFALSVFAEIGANRGVISTWLLDAGKSILQAAVDGLKAAFSKESIQAAMKGIVSEFIPAPVQRWLDNDGKLEEKNGLGKKTLEGLPKGIPAAPVAPVAPTESYLGRAWNWLSSSLVGSANANEFIPPPKGTNPASTPTLDPRPGRRETVEKVRAKPLIQNANFGSAGELRSLISKASFAAPDAVLSGTVGSEVIAKPADPRREIAELTEALRENTEVHRAGLEKRNGFASLANRTSISGPAETVKAALAGSSSELRAASSVLSGSTGSGTMTGGLSPLEGSVPGTRLNGGGLSRRGIIGGAGSYAGSGPGGGVVSPNFRGDQKAIAKTAFDFFRSKGLSAEAASGILANMDAESSFNPRARGDGGKAHGMFQHHPDRRAAILRGTGIDMSTASPEKQLEGTWWEMNHGDAGAQRARKILQTPGISARDAGAAFVKHFERPAKDERAIRGSMAEGFVRQFGSGGGDAVPSSANHNATSSQVLQTARNLSVANQQCVSLAKAAVGASGSVMNWQRGVSAEAGTLKPGTPVATFMDALGRQSSRYAGGGTGTMGANRDHAGIFQEYIKDATGKNIGMRIAEQYRGSGGVKSKDYMFGQGSGAKNGSNYNVVNGADGRPLGGSRNPMNRQVTAPVVPVIKGEIAKAPVVEAAKASVAIPGKPRSMPVGTDSGKSDMSPKGFGLGFEAAKPPQVPNPGRSVNEAGKVQVGRSQRKVDPSSGGFFDGVKGILGYGAKASQKAEAIRANSWKPSDGSKASSPLAEGVEAPKPSITDKVPQAAVERATGNSGGSGSNSNSSSSVHAPITINGAGQNAESIANSVQRKLQADMGRRTHDINFG